MAKYAADIMKRSENVYAVLGRGSVPDIEAIAAAIAGERFRCAEIAKPLPIEPDESDIEKQAHDIRSVIHAAILKRGEA